MYLSKRGYVLVKSEIPKESIIQLKTELRGRPLQDIKFGFQKDNSFPLYTETKNKIYIPKMYGLKKYGKPLNLNSNYKGTYWERDIKFVGNLLEHQHEPCEILFKECLEKGGGILSLQTGFGKTVCSLYTLSQLKKKTIIIVNKITLLRQWENEIRQFLPDAKIGILQGQKNVDVHDKDIIIAMLQSLARIDYPQEIFDDIGCTIFDEVHNTSCCVFSKVLMKLCSEYTIGLSATPTRADGCEYVFKWFLGEIVYESKIERKGLPPIIQTINISSKDYKKCVLINKFTGKEQLQFTSMLSELISMEKRNKLIIELLKDLVKKERKILVLSDRREHLKTLQTLLDKDPSVDFTYGLFVGQMRTSELERSKSSSVILATYQAFGEGVNEKSLDTLVLITPKKYIGHLSKSVKNESGKLEQIIGRIFRKQHTEKNPLIIDLQDNFSVYKNQSTQRVVFYKEHFKNVTIIKQSIDLNKYTIDDININCIITKEKEKPKLGLDNVIDKLCILD